MAEWKSLKSKVVEGGAYFRGGAYFPSCTSQMVLIFVVGAYFRAGLLSRGYGRSLNEWIALSDYEGELSWMSKNEYK